MAVKVKVLFSGDVYSNQLTMTDDNSARFETEDVMLLDVVVIVETYAMLLGKHDAVVYPVGKGATVGFTMVNLSTLYFKNAVAGSNGKISILGVKK
ncbi:MAG: hypothetical protein KAY32_15360 [Candidatus Eisenbacteria sp.]|nr:hypothetical protein [Candidatus Eisenbacteria bacterium]